MSGRTGKITHRKEAAIAGLLAHESVRAAAESAGVNERTLFRWLQEPGFSEAYRRAREESLRQAVSVLQRAMTRAVETLLQIMDNDEAPTGSRVSAARTVLEHGFRGAELLDLEARMKQIEQAIKEQKR